MKNENRPAYPLSGDYYQNEIGRGKAPDVYQGLTKREYFAAMAMQGLCANPNVSVDKSQADVVQFYATVSIKFADELLRQLDKE